MNKSPDPKNACSIENLDTLYMTSHYQADFRTMEQLVYEAAKRAGYSIMAWHGSQSEPFKTFNAGMIGTTMGKNFKDQGFWFSSDQAVAEEFSMMNPEKPKGWVKKFYLKFSHLAVWDRETELQGPAVDRAKKQGADGVLFKNVWDGMVVRHDQYLVFSATQIKPADPVVYDEHGEMLPLSLRF